MDSNSNQFNTNMDRASIPGGYGPPTAGPPSYQGYPFLRQPQPQQQPQPQAQPQPLVAPNYGAPYSQNFAPQQAAGMYAPLQQYQPQSGGAYHQPQSFGSHFQQLPYQPIDNGGLTASPNMNDVVVLEERNLNNNNNNSSQYMQQEFLPRSGKVLTDEQKLQKYQLQLHLQAVKAQATPVPPFLPNDTSPFLSTHPEYSRKVENNNDSASGLKRLSSSQDTEQPHSDKIGKNKRAKTVTGTEQEEEDDDINVDNLLSEHVRGLLKTMPPPEVMKVKVTALFTALSHDITYLSSRFRKFVFLADKADWGKYNPDELECAFEVAVEKGNASFWQTFKGDDQLMARLRNYLAFLISQKRYGESPVLKALKEIPVTTEQFEKAKLIKPLQIFEKRGTADSSDMASRVLKSAKIEANKETRKATEHEPAVVATTKASATTKKTVPAATGGSGSKKVDSTSTVPTVAYLDKNKAPASSKNAIASTSNNKSSTGKTISKSSASSTTNKSSIGSKNPTSNTSSKSATAKSVASSNSSGAASTTTSSSSTSSAAATGSSGGFFKSLQTAQNVQKTKPAAATTKPVSKTKSASPEPVEKPKPPYNNNNNGGGFSVTGHLANIRSKSSLSPHENSSKSNERSISPEKQQQEQQPKKKKKTVHWKDDEDLVDVKLFTPDPSEMPYIIKNANDAKRMEYHEAIHNFAPDLDEEVTWYEPTDIDVEANFPNKQLRDALSIKRGGTKNPAQAEANIQKARESHTLVVYYNDDSEIPLSPAEPTSSMPKSVEKETVTIPLASSLKDKPLVQVLGNTQKDNEDATDDYQAKISKIIGQNTNSNPTKSQSPPAPPPPPATAENSASTQSVQELLSKLGAIAGAPTNSNTSTTPNNEFANSNNNIKLPDHILKDRHRDVRESVRNDTGNPEKYRMACRFFTPSSAGSCRRGEDCMFLHLQE